MPLGIHAAALKKQKSLMLQVFPGQSGGTDLLSSESEDHRRRQAAQQTPAPAATPAPAQPQTPIFLQPPPPSLTPSGPDRHHKWSSHYVRVGKDHINDDNPLNPGYAPTGAASTINAGYAYARDVLLPKIPVGDRIVLIIEGGTWTEDLIIDSSYIDIEGEGRPIITGSWTIKNACHQVHIDNIEIIAPNGGPQQGPPGPNVPIPVPLFVEDGGDVGFEHSSIEFTRIVLRSQVHALFSAGRRIWADHCRFYISNDHHSKTGQNSAAVKIASSLSTTGWSEFTYCLIQGFTDYTINGFAPNGIAIEITAKNGGGPGGYMPNLQTQKIGVLLKHTDIYGTAITDGWTLKHEHCICKSKRGYYISVKGYSEAGFTPVQGYGYFDHTTVYANRAGIFETTSLAGGQGVIVWRHTSHLNYIAGAAPTAFTVNGNASGTLFLAHHTTGCALWNGPGVAIGYDNGQGSTGEPSPFPHADILFI